MKKLMTVVLCIALFACNEQKKELDYAVISGRITNSDTDEFSLFGDRYMRFEQKIKMNLDGTFSDTLKLPKWDRTYSTYVLGTKINLYIRKGDHFLVDVDSSRTENPIIFDGIGADINTYFLDKEKLKLNLIPAKSNVNKLDENEFLQTIKEVNDCHYELLSKGKDLPEEFKVQEEKNLEYDYYRQINTYEFFHGRAIKDSGFKVSKNFMDDYFALDFENQEQFNASFSYQDLVMGRLRILRSIRAKKIKAEGKEYVTPIEWLKTIFEETKNATIRESILKNSTKELLGSTIAEDIKKELYAYYMEKTSDEESIKEVQISFEEAKKLWKGSPSPKFVAYRNHAGGTTSLDDLKGKFVYIDVWATWCGPCKAQIPFLKEVEKKYHDKNIEFVSLSVDKKKDTKKWEKMVVDMELTGIQLLAIKDFDSEFIKSYNITGIPRFILIDPEGNIVTQNAPRPSQEKLIELFNELNI